MSSVIGYEIADFERREPGHAARNREVLEEMLASGKLAPPITSRYGLDRAADAVRLVAGCDKFGTTIATPA